jgi:hypothetical protein
MPVSQSAGLSPSEGTAVCCSFSDVCIIPTQNTCLSSGASMPQWRNSGTGEVRESDSNPGTMVGGVPTQPGVYNSGMGVGNWVQVQSYSQPNGTASSRSNTRPNAPVSLSDVINNPNAGSLLGEELARRHLAKSPEKRRSANFRNLGILMTLVMLVFLSVKTNNSFVLNLILSLFVGFGLGFVLSRVKT